MITKFESTRNILIDVLAYTIQVKEWIVVLIVNMIEKPV